MKKALKLISIVLLCGLPLFGTMLYSAKNLLRFCDGEIPFYIWNKRITKDYSQISKFDTVILGDSVGNSDYCPEYLSETTINLALGGTTPVENYFTLKRALKTGAPIKNVFFTFIDFHLQGEDCLYSRVFYSHLLSFADELTIIKDAYKLKDQSVIQGGTILDWLGYRLWFPSKYLPALLNAGINTRKGSNNDMMYLDDIHRGTYISRNLSENLDYNDWKFTKFFVSPLNELYLHKILEICKKYDINAIFVIPPFHPRIIKTDEYRNQRQDYYSKLIEKYPNAEVVNFDETGEFNDGTNFIDVWHMNIHGSYKFTSLLKEKFKNTVFKNSHNEESSAKTIAGKIDYISLDNNLDSLVNRIDNDFSAIIYNKKNQRINSINSDDKVICINMDKENLSYEERNNILRINIGQNSFEIGKNNQSDLFVLVFHNNKLVSEKRYIFKDDGSLIISR